MKKTITLLSAILFLVTAPSFLYANPKPVPKKPNIVFILVDQWRAQATGYSGDRNVISPNVDRLSYSSINVVNAISGMPVCTPFSFINDRPVSLNPWLVYE